MGAEEIVIITGEARKRALTARSWVAELSQPVPGPARLVKAPDGALWVVEGGRRRRLSAGLLLPALERSLGPVGQANEAEVAGWEEGPPVEVLEAPSAPPFVVIGGERRSLRSLPVPYPVDDALVVALPKGSTLDLAVQTRGSAAPPSALGRIRRSLRRRGPVGTARRVAGAAVREARRAVRRVRP